MSDDEKKTTKKGDDIMNDKLILVPKKKGKAKMKDSKGKT
jgi:hypothetical protein